MRSGCVHKGQRQRGHIFDSQSTSRVRPENHRSRLEAKARFTKRSSAGHRVEEQLLQDCKVDCTSSPCWIPTAQDWVWHHQTVTPHHPLHSSHHHFRVVIIFTTLAHAVRFWRLCSYVSRVNPKDNTNHVVLGTQTFQAKEFATQINLNVRNMWGIVKTLATICMKLPAGRYFFVKDPYKVHDLISSIFGKDRSNTVLLSLCWGCTKCHQMRLRMVTKVPKTIRDQAKARTAKTSKRSTNTLCANKHVRWYRSDESNQTIDEICGTL